MGFSVFVISEDDADGHGGPRALRLVRLSSTQFWVDPENDLFAVYLSRTRDFHWPCPVIQDAVYD